MKIKTITRKQANTIVYNFSVEDDESYVVEGIKTKNCRGIWVPILTAEEQPKLNPIPKSAIDKFDLIDGRPVVNAFKQMKKPINKANKEAQAEIKKRLNK